MTRTIIGKVILGAAISAAWVTGASGSSIETATFDAPDLDQWAYHRLTGLQAGTWETAALFTKHGVAGSEEDHSAPYIAGYDLSASSPAGLGASNYKIHSAQMSAEVVEVNGGIVLDTTYDSWNTHLVTNDPNYATDYVPDSDPGRPVSLFGIEMTNDFEVFSFEPNGGSPTNAPYYNEFNEPMVELVAPFDRNAYPISFDGGSNVVSIKNNVYEGFESNPWAVAYIEGKNPGDAIAIGDILMFDLNVSDPSVQAYLQQALNAGQLGLAVSALHQTGSDGFLRLATNEAFDKQGASLALSFSITPLQLLSLHFEAGLPVLRFTGSADQSFEIQRCGVFGDWETVSDPVLTYPEAGVVEWTDTDPAADQQFYRVRQVLP